jgi:hypothetical protein
LTEGENNALIPVDKWMAFSEKGGLKGSIDLLPLDTLSNALLQCYRAREEIKAQIYEITGISDIIRGASRASETATVGSAIAGYTISSNGGAIASYSISPAIGNGLSFSTTTGLISGRPTAASPV